VGWFYNGLFNLEVTMRMSMRCKRDIGRCPQEGALEATRYHLEDLRKLMGLAMDVISTLAPQDIHGDADIKINVPPRCGCDKCEG